MLAMLESPRATASGREVLERAHGFLDAHQVDRDIPEGPRYYRARIRGSWPFSTKEQSWTVSDCSAEGLKAALKMQRLAREPLSRARLREAADYLVGAQSDDGGWSEYEPARVPAWAELFNAAEVFGPIMRAYSYVECTSACVQALIAFRADDPDHQGGAVARSIERGLDFIRSVQRDDGSWIGSWGVCFSYGTWFGIDGLCAAGRPEDRSRIARAALFLMARQRSDGAWGESYRSCVEERWVDHHDALPVQSAWAILGLLSAYEVTALGRPHREAIERGVAWLLDHQRIDGDWEQQAISGVFNKSCMIHYDNYRHVMPLWALTRYQRLFGSDTDHAPRSSAGVVHGDRADA
jgi:squalene/oxidosqualene cyclase-like protein